MDIRKLQRVVVDALEDVKAQNIKVFNTIGLSDMFDRVVLASGTSNRQTRALAYRVAQQVKEAGGSVVSVEGADAGEWVLVDLGDLVVHVMQPAIREYYGLEEIWGGKPVRVKITESGAKRIAAHAAAAGDGAQAAIDRANDATGQDGKAVAKAPSKAPRKVARKTAAKAAKKTPGNGTRATRAKPARKPARRAPVAKKTARKTPSKSGSKTPRKKARSA
jgi:ribosome-associated protein